MQSDACASADQDQEDCSQQCHTEGCWTAPCQSKQGSQQPLATTNLSSQPGRKAIGGRWSGLEDILSEMATGSALGMSKAGGKTGYTHV